MRKIMVVSETRYVRGQNVQVLVPKTVFLGMSSLVKYVGKAIIIRTKQRDARTTLQGVHRTNAAPRGEEFAISIPPTVEVTQGSEVYLEVS